MDNVDENKNKLDVSVPVSTYDELLKKPNILTKSTHPLKKQIVKAVDKEKVQDKKSRVVSFLQPLVFRILNIGVNFLEWLFLHILYLILIIFVHNGIKLLRVKNPRLSDFASNIISYGWIIVWVIIFFVTLFYHIIFSVFYLNDPDFITIHFSFILTYKVFQQLSFGLGFGLLIAAFLTMVVNGYSLFVFRQSFGHIVMHRQLINRKTGKKIYRSTIAIYLFVHCVVIATFFVWPIFIGIILLTFLYYAILRRNWIHDLLGIKIIKSTKGDDFGVLRRFIELFTFYYRRKAEFVLEAVTKTSSSFDSQAPPKSDTAANSPPSSLDSVEKISPIETIAAEKKVEQDLIVPDETIAAEKKVEQDLIVPESKRNIATALPSIMNASTNSKPLPHDLQKSPLSSLLAQVINFSLFFLAFILALNTFGIWASLRRAHAMGGFFKMVFFRITSPSFAVVFNSQIISRLYLFHDENGNIVSAFNGWHESLQYVKNNINYIISFIPHATSWHDIWNNIEFIVAFLVVNFKCSPIATAGWLLLFFIAFWFFLNIIFIILFGNTFVGFCLSPRSVRLIHANNNMSVSLVERSIYAFFYVTFAFLYLVPVVNLIWFIVNISCFLIYQETLLNRVAGFRYGKPSQSFREDLINSVEVTNSLMIWVQTKFRKELLAHDNI